jgi:hypothetical protein
MKLSLILLLVLLLVILLSVLTLNMKEGASDGYGRIITNIHDWNTYKPYSGGGCPPGKIYGCGLSRIIFIDKLDNLDNAFKKLKRGNSIWDSAVMKLNGTTTLNGYEGVYYLKPNTSSLKSLIAEISQNWTQNNPRITPEMDRVYTLVNGYTNTWR